VCAQQAWDAADAYPCHVLEVFGAFQTLVLYGLAAVGFGVKAWAFVDALRRSSEAFQYAGKRTKNFWLAITGVALAVGVVLILAPLNFLNIIAVVGALVYLVDVRPAVKQYRAGGSASNMGPYGPW